MDERIAPVLAALAGIGATWTTDHEAQLESAIDGVADPDVRTMMTDLANHVTLNGMAHMAQAPLRNAITGSEDDAVNLVNANVKGGIDWLRSWLSSIAKGATS